MVLGKLSRRNHCGWGSDFAIVGCDKPKGHLDAHSISAAAGLPPGHSRAEQESYNERMKGRIFGQSPRPKG